MEVQNSWSEMCGPPVWLLLASAWTTTSILLSGLGCVVRRCLHSTELSLGCTRHGGPTLDYVVLAAQSLAINSLLSAVGMYLWLAHIPEGSLWGRCSPLARCFSAAASSWAFFSLMRIWRRPVPGQDGPAMLAHHCGFLVATTLATCGLGSMYAPFVAGATEFSTLFVVGREVSTQQLLLLLW